MALALRNVALDQLALGRTRDGLANAQRALAKFASRPGSQDQVARSHLEIATAHLTLGERTSAIVSARTGQRMCPRDDVPDVCADIDVWLAAHDTKAAPAADR